MAAIGAGLGLKANIAGLPGKIMVIGTPAEEGGGGKIKMLDAGVFDGVDVVLSSHPPFKPYSYSNGYTNGRKLESGYGGIPLRLPW
ncbi:MAG: hypothetical protein Ct9H300mP11_08030 [Chloroflexota bacterium]|nr:MAG: hypothetical protein Ct9H300mP11_08030 [Chloroflexota bacterium]